MEIQDVFDLFDDKLYWIHLLLMQGVSRLVEFVGWHIKKTTLKDDIINKRLSYLKMSLFGIHQNPLWILYMVKSFPLTVKEETWWGI